MHHGMLGKVVAESLKSSDHVPGGVAELLLCRT